MTDEQRTNHDEPQRRWAHLEFGPWLAEELTRRNLTQEYFATRIGTTQGTVSAWITGYNRPSRQNVQRIAEALAIAAAPLYRRAGYAPPPERPRVEPITSMPSTDRPAGFLDPIMAAHGPLSEQEQEQLRQMIDAYLTSRKPR